MSGEAGASRQSTYYAIFLGTGVNVSVEAPPDEDPTPYIAHYFESESRPYEKWLAAAAPALDRLFDEYAREQRLPLAPDRADHASIYGVVIEDCTPLPDGADARRSAEQLARQDRNHGARFFAEHPGRAVRVQLDASRKLDSGTVQLTIALTAQVKRSQLNALADEVLLVLERAR